MKFAALIALSLTACGIASTNKQAKDILSRQLEAYSQSGDAFIRLDDASYKSLILDKPKKYHVFVIYTANYNMCRICKPFFDALEHVALSYFKAGKHELGIKPYPVFFATVDISVNQEIARMHDMRTLPHIVHFFGKEYDVTKGRDGMMILPEREFTVSKLDVTAQEVLEWVNRETGTSDVFLYYTFVERMTRIGVFVGALSFALFLVVKLVFACRRNPSLIAAVGLFIHYIATSGVFYNILQGMQWVGVDSQGNYQFVLNTARGQFLGEGLVMSALICGSGLSLFAASRIPYTDFGKTASPDILMYLLLTLVLVSVLSLQAVIQVYTAKVGWYSDTSFYPPPWYRQGPLRVDQGNTF